MGRRESNWAGGKSERAGPVALRAGAGGLAGGVRLSAAQNISRTGTQPKPLD